MYTQKVNLQRKKLTVKLTQDVYPRFGSARRTLTSFINRVFGLDKIKNY